MDAGWVLGRNTVRIRCVGWVEEQAEEMKGQQFYCLAAAASLCAGKSVREEGLGESAQSRKIICRNHSLVATSRLRRCGSR